MSVCGRPAFTRAQVMVCALVGLLVKLLPHGATAMLVMWTAELFVAAMKTSLALLAR